MCREGEEGREEEKRGAGLGSSVLEREREREREMMESAGDAREAWRGQRRRTGALLGVEERAVRVH